MKQIKLLEGKMMNKKTMIIIMMLFTTVFVFAGWGDTLKNAADSIMNKGRDVADDLMNTGKNAVEKVTESTKERVGQIYRENKEKIDHTINEAKNYIEDKTDTAVDYYKKTVDPYINNAVNQAVEKLEETLPQAKKAFDRELERYFDKNSEEILQEGKRLFNELEKKSVYYWREMDRYPLLKSALQNTASYYSGGIIPPDDYLTVYITKTALSLIDLPYVDDDQVMKLFETALNLSESSVSNGEAVKQLLVLLDDPSLYSDLYSSDIIDIYTGVFQLLEDDVWDIDESENILLTMNELINGYHQNPEHVVTVVQQAVHEAENHQTAYSQTLETITSEFNINQTPGLSYNTKFLIFVLLIMVFGFVVANYGYKTFNDLSWLWVFGVATLMSFSLLTVSFNLEKEELIAISCVIGFMLAFFSKKMLKILVFIGVVFLVYILLHGILQSFGNMPEEVQILLNLIISLFSGYLVFKCFRFLVILLTSGFGAWLLMKYVTILLVRNSIDLSLSVQLDNLYLRRLGYMIYQWFQDIEMRLWQLVESILELFNLKSSLLIDIQSSRLVVANISLFLLIWIGLTLLFIVLQNKRKDIPESHFN